MPVFKYAGRYFGQFFGSIFFKERLQFLIFFVTSRCNCRCLTCFYWRSLNQAGELSLSEIKKISGSIGKFRTLLLSGGEPFLREDLFEACQLFIEQNNISVLAIPTNCTYPDRIIEFSEKILNKYPGIILSINPSLDGFKEIHDEIRGVGGIYDKVVTALKQLSELKAKFCNLEVVVNTVITRSNIKELKGLMDFIYDNFKVDYHDFELLRGDHKDKNFGLPVLADIRKIHYQIVKNRARYLQRQGAGLLERIAVLGLLLFTQKMKEACLSGKRPFFGCSAGGNIAVIDANADVRLCELLPAVGNLKEYNYDFTPVLNSPKARSLKNKIREENCHCTHVCFLKSSASKHMRSPVFMIYYYLIHKLRNG